MGLDYAYYEGNWEQLPDFNKLSPVKTGIVSTLNLSQRNKNDQYGFRFTGYIQIPTDGIYTFYSSSDDGSQLYIGSTLVVNNNSTHAELEKSGNIGLKAGKHAITVTYFERDRYDVLKVYYAGPGITKQSIPASALYRVKKDSQGKSFVARVNFQPKQSNIPTGYIADYGDVFAAHGNGFSYGWNAPTYETRDRNIANITDKRYETLNHLQKPSNPNAIWEIAVPDGTYRVYLVSSDPTYSDQINVFSVEGRILKDPDGYDHVDEYTTTVEVSDGRLTIKPGPGSQNAKISFVDITQISEVARLSNEVALASPKSFQLFPNPASEVIHLRFISDQPEQVQVTITDALSRTVFTTRHVTQAGENVMDIWVDQFTSGTYLLQLIQGKEKIVERITISK